MLSGLKSTTSNMTMLLALLPLTVWLLGEESCTYQDADNDEWTIEDGDCDDNNSSVYPGQVEVCNGIDDNCDDSVDGDAVDTDTFYVDQDEDRYGDPYAPVQACSASETRSDNNLDCDDADPSIHPNSEETCNGLDDDCDGTTPANEMDSDGDSLSTCQGDCDDSHYDTIPYRTYTRDADEDGFGDIDQLDQKTGCTPPSGYVLDSTDCDDEDDTINPGVADRPFSRIDEDCDGEDAYLIQLDMGYLFVLALDNEGHVWSWGQNTDGQLGDGTTVKHLTPKLVEGIEGAVQVESGETHSLALLEDGTVLAWGDNINGQLGDGTFNDSLTPVWVSSLSSVKSIGAGYNFSVALLQDGTVRTWGQGYNGQLGNGGTTNSAVPVTVTGLSGVTAISVGSGYTLAATSARTAYAWGINDYKQCGTGSSTNPIKSPTAVYQLSGVVGVAAGEYHSMAILEDGTLKAWGYNYYGQLGNGNKDTQSKPVAVQYATDVAAVALGTDHSLAMRGDGSLLGWGSNNLVQLGDDTQTDRKYAALVEAPAPLTFLAASGYSSMAIASDDTMLGWGDNDYGQLGDGLTSWPLTPEPLVVTDIVDLSPGSTFSMALTNHGKVLTWGYNTYGNLGDGTFTNRPRPGEVVGLEGVVAIAAGSWHGLALLDNGAVYAWGYNSGGTLGDGTTIDRSSPVQVQGLPADIAVAALAAGEDTSLALMEDGSLYAWGASCGVYDTTGIYTTWLTPVRVEGIEQVVQADCGHAYCMALLADGTVSIWGYSELYDIFYKDPDPDRLPHAVTNVSNAIAIAAGGYHALALLDDGTVMGWGNNEYLQLNLSTGVYAGVSPTPLPNISRIVEIDTGTYHSIALDSDGTILGWGINGGGELGRGYKSNEAYVGAVADFQLKDLSQEFVATHPLRAGSWFNAIRTSNGSAVGWGYNDTTNQVGVRDYWVPRVIEWGE